MSKRKKIIRALYITIAVLIIAACGFGVLAYMRARNAWENPQDTLKAGADTYGYKDSVVNLVLIGTDSSAAREALNKGCGTDTIVICAIDMEDIRCAASRSPGHVHHRQRHQQQGRSGGGGREQDQRGVYAGNQRQ